MMTETWGEQVLDFQKKHNKLLLQLRRAEIICYARFSKQSMYHLEGSEEANMSNTPLTAGGTAQGMRETT
jgi:hypothetical protein